MTELVALFATELGRFQGLITALGVGLLIGLVRERRRNDADAGPSAAGLRTHALAALGAAVAWTIDPRVFLVLLAVAGALVVVSYRRTAVTDVGLTGEFGLLITLSIGALAVESPGLAAALGVVTAGLLHLRTQLHHLGREVISEQEMHDGLLLAAGALVVLPLLPDAAIDPWGVIVPASLWKLVVLVMGAGVAGQIGLRMVGARFGLPLAGFFAGFASSTAATVGYGQRVRATPALTRFAVAAALFANLATLLLLVAVLATGNAALLRAVGGPLLGAGLTLLIAGSAGLVGSAPPLTEPPAYHQARAFKLSHAFSLALFVAAVLIVAAISAEVLGERGAIAAAVIAGMVELQGAALAIGQLTAVGQIALADAEWAVILLLAASGAVKSGLAVSSGGRAYGLRVATGLTAAVAVAITVAWVW